MKKYFVNGKEFTDEVTVEDSVWLTERSSRLDEDEVANAWDVGDINQYRTWLERVAIMTLMTTVSPQEACVLVIDVWKERFKILRLVNGFIMHEVYKLGAAGQIFFPLEILLETDSKEINWVTMRGGQYCSPMCEVSWNGHDGRLCIDAAYALYQTWEKRTEIDEYLDTLNPDNINYFSVFKKIRNILGINTISVCTSNGEWRICGNNHGLEEVSEVIATHKKYQLRYQYGNVSYYDDDIEIAFTTPSVSFDEFFLKCNGDLLSDKKKLDKLVEKAKEKAEHFWKKIQKL